MKIGIGIPNGDDFKAELVSSLAMMAYSIGKQGHDISFISVQSCYVDRNRNTIFRHAKSLGLDWLLYLDTDVECQDAEDVLIKLLAHNEDVVTGVYYGGMFPYRPVIFNFVEDGKLYLYGDTPDEPFYVDATGGGFLLVSKKVLDAFDEKTINELGQPWDFMFEGNTLKYREDLAFCWRLKQLGFKVLADPTIKLNHIKKHPVSSGHFEAAKRHMVSVDAVPDGGIPGWMTEEELAFLAERARGCQSIAEIGSWKGRSTKALLDNCPGTVYAIDHWKGSDTIKPLAANQDVYGEFMKNVGHYTNLVVKKMDSIEASHEVQDGIDMVFIDAGHDYQDVVKDITAWRPKARKVICGHDYRPGFPGVMRAVDEVFPDRRLVGSIWYKEVA